MGPAETCILSVHGSLLGPGWGWELWQVQVWGKVRRLQAVPESVVVRVPSSLIAHWVTLTALMLIAYCSRGRGLPPPLFFFF